MRVFHCDHCGQLVFFESTTCPRCGRALAFLPDRRDLASLERHAEGTFHTRDARLVRLCANYVEHRVCNWAVAAGTEGPLCRACTLTRTIPNLGKPENLRLWHKLEVAKRRLVYTFDALGIPLRSKHADPERGVAFEFLEGALTAHANGVVTVALEEADDVVRTRRRAELREPYRTLLGHLRHESGHCVWSELVCGAPRLDSFRALFGDERADYAEALRRHYGAGPPSDWEATHVSAYATMHPWEDWAETWAHYLHMIDTLETARASGVSVAPSRSDEPAVRSVPDPTSPVPFQHLMESWSTLTYVLDNLNRGLGLDDPCPSVLSAPAAEKLRFVHDVVAEVSAARHAQSR